MWIYKLTKEEIRYRNFFDRVLCIDEVNIFSYWGNIIICGVIIPKKAICPVKDSKLLNDNQISEIAKKLKNNIEYYIDMVSVNECNKNYLINEFKAIYRIIKKAKPKAIIIDYYSLPNLHRNVKYNLWQLGYFKADEKLWTCASASIIAKDELNNSWDNFIEQYPEYKNTGKGTLIKRCIEPLFQYGVLKDYHRINWIKSALNTMKIEKKLLIK